MRVNQIKALEALKSAFRRVSAATPSGAWRSAGDSNTLFALSVDDLIEKFDGGDSGIRTPDLRIMIPSL